MSPRRVVIVGGGIAGLAAALGFGARGDNVVVLERDDTPTPTSAEEAWTTWKRRGAPQVRQPHVLLARVIRTIRNRYPDVYDKLIALGAGEYAFARSFDPAIVEYVPAPGDDDLTTIGCRRTTFEWVLRTSATAHAQVSFRPGALVVGLLASPASAGRPPHVSGVRLDGGEELAADLTVVAEGRRSDFPQWCAELGARDMPDVVEDTGIIYVSRFYRRRHGRELPVSVSRSGLATFKSPYLNGGVFLADDGTASMTFAVPRADVELRRTLCTEEGFDRAVTLVLPFGEELLALWEPISGVAMMSGMINRWRDIVVDGIPIVTGAIPVGDSVVCTNPAYGRGMSTAFWSVDLLLDALGRHTDDPVSQVLAYDAALRQELYPWYAESLKQDRINQDLAAAALSGDRSTPQSEDQLIAAQFEPLLRTDVAISRAFWRMLHLLDSPDAMRRPETVALILAALARPKPQSSPREIPPRQTFLQLISAGHDAPIQPRDGSGSSEQMADS